jgi:hypothetical protein
LFKLLLWPLQIGQFNRLFFQQFRLYEQTLDLFGLNVGNLLVQMIPPVKILL